ncbi:MAG: winged helix-turn-helix transcriptional regulator, partial [Candidatus Aenigmarchaeota archaeon]|nr:winged helix-turn-helix transcriptional regulator [Candidatus Aenigmarchaeota archaeon]
IIDKKDFTAEVFSNYEDVMKFLYKNLKIIYRIEGFGPRKEILEIPEDALKEAIINSIAHRDYNEKGARIQIDIFDDRVEISNPGGLIIKEEEFGKRSLSRNPLIFSLLQKLELVEQVGSGINRIKNAMRKTRLRKPDFEFGKFFSVTLFRPTSEDIGRLAGMKTTQKTTQKILALIKENPEITRNELANSLGISSDGVKYHLNNLKKEGILKHIGGRKGGHWVVLE